MKTVAILTDTNSGITPEKAKEKGIELMAMPVFIDGKEYFEYADITLKEFFDRLTGGAQVSTSQPSPGMVTDRWDKILENYDTLIYFPMSSGLSSACALAKVLAAEYENRVFVADNKCISGTLYESVMDAAALREQGKTAEEIVAFCEQQSEHAVIYFLVDTLEYLKKGGRITPAEAAIGMMLGIKPVLTVKGGKLEVYKKVRGIKAAMETAIDGIVTDLETRSAGEKMRIRTAYSGDEKVGRDWQRIVAGRFPDFEIEIDPIPISISCHTGPGALGVGIFRTVRD